MKLLTVDEYMKDATREVEKAGSRVYAMTLAIGREERTKDFMDSIVEASERGLDVNVAADLFTFSEFGGYFSPLKRYSKRSRSADRFTKMLINSKVNFTWLGGNHKLNPFAGLTHTKWVIVDDIVYSFGGINLYGKGAKFLDYMFKVKNKKLADILVAEHRAIVVADKGPASYTGYSANFEIGEVLIDSGKRGESVIYERACKLAEKASSILLVSQYSPTGKLADILKHKHAKMYFNTPANASFWTALMLRVSELSTGIASSYKKKQYIHAKFIIYTMPDGSKIALTGSHNFSYSGVRFGTREVELETRNQKIIAQLEDFLKNYVA